MVEVNNGVVQVRTQPNSTPFEDDFPLEERRSRQLNGATGQTTNIAIEPPPDGGYGWVCVACYFLINAHTWGINTVSSLYEGPV